MPELGYSRITEKSYFSANTYFFFSQNSFPNVDTISSTKLAYKVNIAYLRNVKPSFYLGVNWDILDYYKRNTELLDNAADAYKLSSDFYISGKYLWDLSQDWQFNFGLSYGLFSFINTEPSFSANFQQNIIDNGEVTFIDSDTKSPFKLRNMALYGFWNELNIQTSIELNFRRRLGLSYSWDLKTYADTKKYPVTDARHILTLRYLFINHPKN